MFLKKTHLISAATVATVETPSAIVIFTEGKSTLTTAERTLTVCMDSDDAWEAWERFSSEMKQTYPPGQDLPDKLMCTDNPWWP